MRLICGIVFGLVALGAVGFAWTERSAHTELNAKCAPVYEDTQALYQRLDELRANAIATTDFDEQARLFFLIEAELSERLPVLQGEEEHVLRPEAKEYHTAIQEICSTTIANSAVVLAKPGRYSPASQFVGQMRLQAQDELPVVSSRWARWELERTGVVSNEDFTRWCASGWWRVPMGLAAVPALIALVLLVPLAVRRWS